MKQSSNSVLSILVSRRVPKSLIRDVETLFMDLF